MEDMKKAIIQGVSCGCHPSNGKFALWFRAQLLGEQAGTTVIIPSGSVAPFVESFEVQSVTQLNGRIVRVMQDAQTKAVRYLGPSPKDSP